MDVLRHHHITVNAEIEAGSDTLECYLKRLLAVVRREERAAMVTRERNEVALSGFVKPSQADWHAPRLFSRPQSSQQQG